MRATKEQANTFYYLSNELKADLIKYNVCGYECEGEHEVRLEPSTL